MTIPPSSSAACTQPKLPDRPAHHTAFRPRGRQSPPIAADFRSPGWARAGNRLGEAVGMTAGAADEFDALRRTWRDMLTGGAADDPADPAIAPAIRALDARVRR